MLNDRSIDCVLPPNHARFYVSLYKTYVPIYETRGYCTSLETFIDLYSGILYSRVGVDRLVLYGNYLTCVRVCQGHPRLLRRLYSVRLVLLLFLRLFRLELRVLIVLLRSARVLFGVYVYGLGNRYKNLGNNSVIYDRDLSDTRRNKDPRGVERSRVRDGSR